MDWIRDRLASFGERAISVDADGEVSYAAFLGRVSRWRQALEARGVRRGDRVALVADYHIEVVALLQALLETGCIVIPLSEDDRALFPERLAVACANRVLDLSAGGVPAPDALEIATPDSQGALHPLMEDMVLRGKPGFIIFTSGSTGKGKAVLLDHARMVKKFEGRTRDAFRTLLFLKLDHIGGLNTLLSVVLNGGTIVTAPSRQARDICACIERHRVELLPTTPSFLTMLLMSGIHRHHDLSSLKVITYGTEVMPVSTLASMCKTFPQLTLKQTYGLSELGILATRSKDSTSRWMKIGGDGFEIRVKDDTLWIRSEQAMLGYLNAPSPFDEAGWYNTGDKVEVDGEYFQILGRESEIINVGGEKVFPIEVESFLLTLDNVRDVVVREKKSPVVGQMVWAEFLLEREEDPAAFRKRVIDQCQQHLAPFKVPGFITIARGDSLVGSRFKKIRKTGDDGAHGDTRRHDAKNDVITVPSME